MDLRILDIVEDTWVDGPGLRTSIYAAGCRHHCPGCHNPQSWDFNGGTLMSVEQIMERIMLNPFDDVTFSGGDPMFQAEGFTELAKAIHQQTKKNIWCYTGFLYEQLLDMPAQRQLLEQIDVLVDGPFIQAQRNISLRFRGSNNQRMIDVKQSLRLSKIVLWDDSDSNQSSSTI